MWYDDAKSLAVKADLVRNYSLAGVALWSVDALWNVPTPGDGAAVWTAVDVRA